MNETERPVRLTQLRAENVKRLRAVTVDLSGNVIVIGGENGAGKSSVLDAIAMALGGKTLCQEMPLRRGEERGFAEVTLDNGWTVRRTFTAAGGGNLTITTADGARFASPQELLDKIVGRLSFDPGAFLRMEPKRQLETLRGLVGLDFADLDAERARLFDERTEQNRAVKAAANRLDAMPARHEDAPAEEVSIANLVEELDAAQFRIREIEGTVTARDEWIRDIPVHERRVAEAEARLAEAQANLERERQLLDAQREGAEEAKLAAHAALATKPDVAPIRAKIASADALNRMRRENAAREDVEAERRLAEIEAGRLSDAIVEIDRRKAAALVEAAFPVAGLSFGETGVLFNGIPFSQASQAEKIRVSMAMALALNPRLRLALIRDASLMNAESRRIVAELAAAANAQVIEEVVEDGPGCTIVIEDGMVRGAEDEAAPAADAPQPGLFDAGTPAGGAQ